MPLNVELLVGLVPFGLEIDDSCDTRVKGSSGKSVVAGGERSSLSGVGDTGNSDVVVRSRVETVNGEGLGRGLHVDPNTSGVNLVRNLPS